MPFQSKRKVITITTTRENIAIAEASREIIQRHGNAAREFVVAYEGIDNAAEQILKKGLKGISQSKVNPKYAHQNLRQQAGFSAEVLDTARTNAKNIIDGRNVHATRTDDLSIRVDDDFGRIGGVNDRFYDQAITQGGKIVDASQFKFIGGSPEDALTKLMGKKFDKYIDNGVKITVPSDYYDGIKDAIPVKIEKLQKQLERAKEKGQYDLAQEKAREIERCEKLSKTLRKSNLSNEEAMQARLAPLKTTVKEIAGVSHQAGLQGAKYGIAISGGISVIQNITEVIAGKKDFSDAAIDVVYDAGTGAAMGYVSNFGITALTGTMKNSASSLMRSIAKTNLPAQVAVGVLEAGKTLIRFASGEIDGVECLEELGEKGTRMTSAAMFAGVGQAVIPIPVVGAIAGSMIGYSLSGAFYGKLKEALTSAKLAHEERIRIERECEEAIKAIRDFRAKMEALISEYLVSHITAFRSAFNIMGEALSLEDADQFIMGANMITRKLGGQVQFNSMKEFDVLMTSDEAFVL